MELEFIPVQQVTEVVGGHLREPRRRSIETHQDAASLAQNLPLVGRETIHGGGRAWDELDLDRPDYHRSSISIAW